ncbi:hypothetical protein HKT18_09315 [Flavobacterium sp. IMCC34852]|uniref:Uncharacterized protein n=1 Tax=Flavobacterium rivulicola TaxID=2732161 RepID=A0A7Y3RAF2_9FLAO|nr:hypothetical protein [Flavobacterium sp. IMCC34852]NNT72411.1 hypothetical protein [Flavobacterium sp. IMCC34852]
MKKLFFIICLFWFYAANAITYPISPRPLRMLVSESKHIIVGHVIKVEKITRKINRKQSDTDTFAYIVVNERLQGSIKDDTIKIEFEPGMICPASDMYYENTDVLAFLDEENGKYATHALSYGSKTLDKEGIAIYKERIQEIQSILKVDNTIEQLKQTVEWLVKCAENHYTQWEGTFELSPDSHFMSFYSRSKAPDFELLLSNDQKERLKTALIKSADQSYLDLGLVDLVYEGNENEIDALMLKNLKALVDEDYNWFASDYMQRLVHLNNSDEANKLIKDFDDVIMDYDKDKKGKAIILKFISLIENKP